MKNDYFVEIRDNIGDGVRIWIGKRNGPGGKMFVAQPIPLTMTPFEEGEIPEPTLTLPRFEAYEFLQKLAEALDQKGVKTDKNAKLEGTLSATQYHLEDLR